MEKDYTVYCHINKYNNKKYVGITSQKRLSRRFQNGQGYKHSTHFYNAINMYGWDNFDHIVLESNLSEEEAKAKEEQYISSWNLTNNLFGYNITEGGEHTSVKGRIPWNKGTKVSPEGCELMSKRMKDYYETEEGKLRKQQIGNEHRGVPLSEETKKKMSEAQKGKKISEEQKKKISEARKGMKFSEETKKKMSEAQKKRFASSEAKRADKISEEQKKKISEAMKGRHWYNNGEISVMAYECPEGFESGRLRSK